MTRSLPVPRPSLLAGLAALLAVGVAYAPTATADEGMYLLHEASRLDWRALKRRGMKLTPAQLKALTPAIVQLARGGTGSFVSPDGLIVTNHHVAYRCLVQLDGSSHPGILDRGYVAKTRKAELPCPSYDMLATQQVTDVTAKVLSAVKPGMSPEKRALAIRVQRRTLERDCEKTRGRICQVRPLNGGAGFTLSIYKRIRDVRLVYAPPKALGKFGGDVDNWRYPRHTADFSFLRAYVSPKGAGRAHHARNVPYHPKRWLKVATTGIRRNQLTFVMGFPGRTMRHATYARARYQRDHVMRRKARMFRALLGVLPKTGLTHRRYGSLDAGLNNAAKYYEDSLKQFRDFNLLVRKRAQQRDWLRKGSRAPLQKLLTRISSIYTDAAKHSDRALMLTYLGSRIVRSLSTAVDIVRWSRLRRVPDLRREGERYRDKNLYRVYQQSDLLEKMTTPQGERALLHGLLGYAMTLPKAQQPQVLAWLRGYGTQALKRLTRQARRKRQPLAKAFAKATGGTLRPAGPARSVHAALDFVYARTKLYPRRVDNARAVARAVRARKRWFKASAAKVKRGRDPLLQLAVRLVDEQDRLRKGPLKVYLKVLAPILRPRLVKQFIRPRYWDANFTLRVSFGTVKDYTESATAKRWRYVSRLTWLIRKGRGKVPFLVPNRLRAVYKRRDFGRWVDPVIKDVPVDFTTTLDTTGGNSGSPVLNGRGELVGLLFDGTPESILSDWQYLERKQRSICVDIRVVLFLADKVDHATAVLRELGLAR